MSLSQEMGNMKLSTVMSPENVRVIQLALYYDFVLYNMHQKPFRVLLVSGNGAINSHERGKTIMNIRTVAANMIDMAKELHDALVKCLSDKSKCDIGELNTHIEYFKILYDPTKIKEFKTRGKTTPDKLYDLLNPGDGDINTAIQNAVRQIKEYTADNEIEIVYLGDEVFTLISSGAAAQFLNGSTVAAMRSIMDDGIALPPKERMPKGGRTQRRGSKRRGSKRRGSKRRGTKRRGSKRRGSKRRGTQRSGTQRGRTRRH